MSGYTWDSNGHSINFSQISQVRGYVANEVVRANNGSSANYSQQGVAVQKYGITVPATPSSYANNTATAYPNKGYLTNYKIPAFGGLIADHEVPSKHVTIINNGNSTIPKGAVRMILIARGGGGGEGGGGGGARAMQWGDSYSSGGAGGNGEGGKFAYTNYAIPSAYASGNYSVAVAIGAGGGGGNNSPDSYGRASHGYSPTHAGQTGANGGNGGATTIKLGSTTLLTANGGTRGTGGIGGRTHGPQGGWVGAGDAGTSYNIGYNRQDYRRDNGNTPTTWSVHHDYSGVMGKYFNTNQYTTNQTLEYGRGGYNAGGGGSGSTSPNTAGNGASGESGKKGFAKIFYIY